MQDIHNRFVSPSRPVAAVNTALGQSEPLERIAGERAEADETDLSSWLGAPETQDDGIQVNAKESDVRELGAGELGAGELAAGETAVRECEFLHAYQYSEQAGWQLQPRAHSHHELVVVREGVLVCRIGGQELRVGAGQVLLLPPTVVYDQCAPEGAVRLVNIGMRWAGYRPGMPTSVIDEKGRLGELSEWLLSERNASFQDAGAFRLQLLRAMVCEYLRLSEASGWEPQQHNPEHPMVRTVLAFIRDHLSEHFTLDDLAGQAKMSKFYFARAYRSLTGLSPMDHARLIRLEAARELLLSTNLPLKSIAPQVGFASEFHLSRLLRTRLGVGARQIRSRAVGG